VTQESNTPRRPRTRWRNAAFEALPDGAVVVDCRGRVADLNPRAAQLLGRPADACLGRPVSELLPGWQLDGSAAQTVEVAVPGAADRRRLELHWRWLGGAGPARLVLLREGAVQVDRNAHPPALAPLGSPARRADLLAQILSVGDFLRLHPDTGEALQEIVNAARAALGFDIVVLNLLDPNTGVYDLHAFAGLTPEGQEVLAKAAYTREIIAPLMREEFRKGRCYFIPAGAMDWEHDFAAPTYNPLANDPGWSKLAESDAWDPQDALMVPVESRSGEIVGLLWVDAPLDGRRPREETLRALEIFANQAAVALDNARLFAEVQHLTLVDELTGLHNRRGFFQIGVREFERTRRFHRPLCAFFLDIDHFRDFNNRYSHAVGDEVLRAVAGQCRDTLRSIDIVARYGGEEFVALLLETPLDAALSVAERLRREVETMRVPTVHGPLSVTVSVGVAVLSDELPDLAALVDRANHAEHLAKERGRNCVATAP